MFIPGRWLPSSAQKIVGWDAEGRLREFNLSRQSTGGIGDANSLYATEAERFDSVAPHLKANMAKDRPRRNYIIQPGGACIYFGAQRAPSDPYDNGRVQYTVPDPRTSFGHEGGGVTPGTSGEHLTFTNSRT